MTDKQAAKTAEKNDVIVEGYGVRGKDFLEIWQSPKSPGEQIRVARDQYAKFTDGLLVTRTDEQEAAVERAAPLGKYVRSDPDVTKPFVCKVGGCNTKWYSADAFTVHTEWKHTGLFRK